MPRSNAPPSHRPGFTPMRCRIIHLASFVCLLFSCTPEKKATPPESPSPLLPAEITLAQQHLNTGRFDLALANLAADPAHEETRAILNSTIWHLPTTRLDHPDFDVHHIAIHGESLWVALARLPFHTVVRWNLKSLEIDAVLFPTREPLRTLLLSPTASHAVVTRGDVSLLIDAKTLKPIADLGKIPTDITPESAIAFSRDSLLLAHPADSAWHIRDTATGQIIRRIGLDETPTSPVLAAHIDPHRLRLLTADGTRIDAPVSPIEPLLIEPFDEEPLDILHAHLIQHGDTAIIIRNLGPHEPPAAVEFDLVENVGSFPLTHFDIDAWASHQHHSNLPGLATGLLRHFDPPPLTLTESAIIFHGHPQSPLLTESPPVAYASAPDTATLATAESSGRITLHSHIQAPDNPTPETLTAIAGHQYHRDTATYEPLTASARHAALFDPTTIRTIPAVDHLLPLWHRLTDALPPDSPELETFPDIATPTDHTPARQLAAALTQDDPAAIAAILSSAENLPPTLRTLATSHIHHRNGNTAAAFAPYHHGFPDITAIREREDWRGWEQPDFQPAVTTLEDRYRSIIATLTIAPEADESARHETIARLTNPAALETLGRTRFAAACLDAADALTLMAGEAEHAFTLATLARHHGAPIAPCLRAEALALTALEDYPNAHTRWIALITEHPAETHLPGDYAEAAYTAFENAEPRQAIEILITGMHRFGEDPAFALRAGWIALLTNHPDHARAFLLKGRDVGFPDDELEHATALLTASAVLTHNADAATAHFQDLISLDPTWAAAETIESLPWPEHLKAPLRQLTW